MEKVYCTSFSLLVAILVFISPTFRVTAQEPTEKSATPVQTAPLGSVVDLIGQQALGEAFQGKRPIIDISPKRPAVYATNPEKPIHDRGTRVVPNSNARGEMVDFQNKICILLMHLNIRPPERNTHFSWLMNQPLVQNGTFRFVGWHGGIIDVQRSPTGTSLIKIHMYPWIYHPSIDAFQPDHVVEIYEYSNGSISLIESDALLAKPNLQVFPPSLMNRQTNPTTPDPKPRNNIRSLFP